MVIKAKVVGRFNSEDTSFARLVLKGNPWRKNSPMFRFFDIVDDGELSIGDKLEITVTRVVEIDVAKVEKTVYEEIRDDQIRRRQSLGAIERGICSLLFAPYEAAAAIPGGLENWTDEDSDKADAYKEHTESEALADVARLPS